MGSGACVALAQEKTGPAQTPDENRDRDPHHECCEKRDGPIRHRQQLPGYEPEADEADASDCREPRASRAAASRPRVVFAIPALLFFSSSCFSRRVALAGKSAGKARNKPPNTGP